MKKVIKKTVQKVSLFGVVALFVAGTMTLASSADTKLDVRKFQVNSLIELPGNRVEISGLEITGQSQGADYWCDSDPLHPPCTVEGEVESISTSTYILKNGYTRENGLFQ